MPTKKKKSRREVAKYLHKRIVFQLVIFTLISLAMFSLVIFDVVTNNLGIGWVLLGAVVGVIVGLVAGRAFALHWHEDSQQVIMTMDRLGIGIIIVYVLIRMGSQDLSHQLFQGVQLAAVTYSLLGGVMIGRVVSLNRRIRRLLREQKII